ncbi:2750_t:CDS:2, partial [Racocetra fulgida]
MLLENIKEKKMRQLKETSEERKKYLEYDRKYQQKKLKMETAKEHKEHLRCQCERISQKRTLEAANQRTNQNSDQQQSFQQSPITEFDATKLDMYESNEIELNATELKIIDNVTLNEKQNRIFKRIKSHYHSILSGLHAELLRIIVMGTA